MLNEHFVYYKPRDCEPSDVFDDEIEEEGECEIQYFNGFDFLITIKETGQELIAQEDEIYVDGVSLEELIKGGKFKLPDINPDILILTKE